MKKILLVMGIMVLAVAEMLGQSPAPGILNYQGVARNSVGNALVNKNITLRLTIRDNTAAGPTVYQETRNVTTNPFGLFNVQLGSPGASGVSGTIAGIPWGVGLKFIQVEIDPNGGSSFINIGTAQLASVPYSLYSSLANDLVLPFNKTQADAGTLFKITNSGTGSGSTALEGLTNSQAANASAIIGTVTSTAPGGSSAGVRGANNGTGGNGIGVYGSQAGSGWGVYGTTPSGIGVRGSSTSGTGVWGGSNTGVAGIFINTNAANASDALQASTNGTGWAASITSTNGSPKALLTAGGIRFTGIGEGAPLPPSLFKLLAGDPAGNGTWQHASAIGLVSGSGTLNYVPKWTPDGTTLGNSQIFDNGTSVGVGIITPNAANKLEVAGIQRINNTNVQEGGELRLQEGTLFGAPNHWIMDNFQSFAGGNKFRLWNDVGGMNIQMMPGGKTAIGNMVFSDQPQSVLDVEGNLTVGANYAGTNAAPANGAIIEGNVGIGITAPTSKLHIASTVAEIRLDDTDNASRIVLTAPGTGYTGGVGTITNHDLPLFTNNTDRVLIKAVTGDVGIGTATPISKLHVAGSTTIQDGTQGIGKLFFDNGAGVGTGLWSTPAAAGIVTGTGVATRVAFWNSTSSISSNSNLYWDNVNSRLGVGTNTPVYDINISKNTEAGIHIDNTGPSGGTVWLGTPSAFNTGGVGTTSNNDFPIFTNNTDRVMVKAGTGNVGIGTSTPLGKLNVSSGSAFLNTNLVGSSNVGTWLSMGNTDPGGRWFNIVSTATANGEGAGKLIFFQGSAANNATGQIMTMDHATLNVGLGTSSPTSRLHVINSNATGRAEQVFNTDNTNADAGLFVQSNRITNASNFYENSAITGNLPVGAGATMVSGATAIKGIAPLSSALSFSSGIGVQGVTAGGYGVIGNAREGVALAGVNWSTGYGLFTQGRIQLSGQGAGINRILTSDATGNATWEAASASGIVSGSGTLNYVPKWTPDGVTIGNSQIFDNGTSVGIGTTTPSVLHKLDVQGTISQMRLMDTDDNSQLVFSAPGASYTGGVGMSSNHNLPFFTNDIDRMTITANGNVGIATSTPGFKLELNNTTADPTSYILQDNSANTGNALLVRNRDNLNASAAFNNNAISAIRGSGGTVTYLNNTRTSIFSGTSNNDVNGVGIQSYGPFAGTIGLSGDGGIGLYGYNFGTGYGLVTLGQVQIQGQGAAAGAVLTSDAAGNATWQDATATRIAFAARGLTSAVSVPLFTFVPITQWAVVDYEEGSVGNYNAGTGEYTVPKSGKYHVNSSMVFDAPAASGLGYSGINVTVNGVSAQSSYNSMKSTDFVNGLQLSLDLNVVAGDVIAIRVFHNTSGSVTLNNVLNHANTWSIHLIK